MKQLSIDLAMTDWKQLRAQKRELANLQLVVLDPDEDKKIIEALDGLLSWIDDIQDQAALQLGSKKVFGK
jgi:hypothetical protein